jgi:peptidoglycan/LPS O-acetylase OafA/YrhL
MVLFLLSVVIAALVTRHWAWAGAVWWKIGILDMLVALCVGCVVMNPVLAFVFRLPVVAWLGKISYGLYVYQKFFVNGIVSVAIRSLCLQVTGGHGDLISWGLGMLINSLALIGVSAASYYCFERWFLKFKERFETILSRPA